MNLKFLIIFEEKKKQDDKPLGEKKRGSVRESTRTPIKECLLLRSTLREPDKFEHSRFHS